MERNELQDCITILHWMIVRLFVSKKYLRTVPFFSDIILAWENSRILESDRHLALAVPRMTCHLSVPKRNTYSRATYLTWHSDFAWKNRACFWIKTRRQKGSKRSNKSSTSFRAHSSLQVHKVADKKVTFSFARAADSSSEWGKKKNVVHKQE